MKLRSDASSVLEALRQCRRPPSLVRVPPGARLRTGERQAGPLGELLAAVATEGFRAPGCELPCRAEPPTHAPKAPGAEHLGPHRPGCTELGVSVFVYLKPSTRKEGAPVLLQHEREVPRTGQNGGEKSPRSLGPSGISEKSRLSPGRGAWWLQPGCRPGRGSAAGHGPRAVRVQLCAPLCLKVGRLSRNKPRAASVFILENGIFPCELTRC